MHGAGAALRYAAPELGAGKSQDIAQHPEQGHIGWSIDIPHFAVYPQTNHEVPLVEGKAMARGMSVFKVRL
jgi:hypothetical protein